MIRAHKANLPPTQSFGAKAKIWRSPSNTGKLTKYRFIGYKTAHKVKIIFLALNTNFPNNKVDVSFKY